MDIVQRLLSVGSDYYGYDTLAGSLTTCAYLVLKL